MRTSMPTVSLCSTLALATLIACTDATGIEPVNLEGTWTAEAMAMSNGTDIVDLIALGAAMTVTLNVDGTFSWLITEPGLEPATEDVAGTFFVSGTTLTLTEAPEGDSEDFHAVRDGDRLTLTVADLWDFDGDGALEAATLTIGLTR